MAVEAQRIKRGDGGELIVLGTGQRESRGVKRGYVADMAATELAIREAVEQALDETPSASVDQHRG